MAYKSPIQLFQTKYSEMREDAVDKAVLEEIHKLGVLVDRGELVKALEHDRDQYQKGYADGRADAAKWISVEERLPEKSGYCLCWIPKYTTTDVIHYSAKHMAFNAFDTTCIPESVIPVTHWMPLPEPPGEEEDEEP